MALSYVTVLLCSPSSPRVRIAVAEHLSVALLTYGENVFPPDTEDAGDSSQRCDQALELLADMDWSQPVATLKPVRDRLCSLFGIRSPSSASST